MVRSQMLSLKLTSSLRRRKNTANKNLALTEEQQAKSLRSARAANQALMSAIYVKKGKIKEAEKAFQAIYASLPSLDSTSILAPADRARPRRSSRERGQIRQSGRVPDHGGRLKEPGCQGETAA